MRGPGHRRIPAATTWRRCCRTRQLVRARAALAVAARVAARCWPPAPLALAAAPQTSLSEIASEVMCPVCGTLLELAESPQAQREKAFVSRLIAEGKSKDQIKDALVAEYGTEVLALPQGSGFDLSAYLVPIVAFVVAVIALAIGVLRWRRAGEPPRPRAAGRRRRAQRRGRRAPRRRPRPLRPLSSARSVPPTRTAPTRSLGPAACAARRRRSAAGAARDLRRARWQARSVSACAATASRAPSVGAERRAGEDDQVVGAAQFRERVAEALELEQRRRRRPRDRRRRRRPAAPRPRAPPGRRAPAAAGSAARVASQRRYSCRPGAGARAQLDRQPRPRQVALEQRRAAPGGAGGARRGRSPRPAPRRRRPARRRLARPGLPRSSASASRSARRSDQARAVAGARGRRSRPGRAACGAGRITSARERRSRAARAPRRSSASSQRQSASRERSTPSPSAPTTWQSR